MTIRRSIVPVILSVLSLVAATAPRAADDGATRDEIAKLEAAWNDAHLQGDADTLTRLLADDIVILVPGMAPIDKAGALGVLKAGHMKFSRYETSETLTRAYGDAAVVTGRLQRTRTMGDRTMNDDLRFTKVWVRRAGQWQAVSFQATAIAP
ncbi:MAG TPA: nuclear transport factor 2 family protein [Verrucomicrobiae bacterium]|nr:nuclear transport factor 2 family protein [Verrucomicrobiae bacterium]